MAIINDPMTRAEVAAAIRSVTIENNEESRRHFKVISRRIRRGGLSSSKQPMVVYTGFHSDSILYGPDRCIVDARDDIVGSKMRGQVIVLYVCDYSRKVASRAFVRDADDTVHDRLLDSFETIMERDAADGARMMVASNPGGW